MLFNTVFGLTVVFQLKTLFIVKASIGSASNWNFLLTDLKESHATDSNFSVI